MDQTITLNLPYDLSDEDWGKVSSVYEQMDGWLNADNGNFWYGNSPDSPFIYASSEPSGLVIDGNVDEMIWLAWITKLCAKLSIALNREVYDAEM